MSNWPLIELQGNPASPHLGASRKTSLIFAFWRNKARQQQQVHRAMASCHLYLWSSSSDSM